MTPTNNDKRLTTEDLFNIPKKKPKPEQKNNLSALSNALTHIRSEIAEFSQKIKTTHIVDSKKYDDLTNRIFAIRENILKQDTSEDKETLLKQLQHHENALRKAVSLEKSTVEVTYTSGKKSTIPTYLVDHIATIRDFREYAGDGVFELPESITRDIFEAIVDLVTILHPALLENPEGRNNLLDIALSKTPIGTDFPITKGNWILLYQASNYLGCNAVSRLCRDFAEKNVNLADFNPEDSTKPGWAHFVKNLPEKFLNKMVNQSLNNPEALGHQFSLFGPAIKKLDLSQRKTINQDKLNNFLEMCPNLEELDVSWNTHITEIPKSLTHLKILNLEHTGLTQAALNNLPERCPHLEELNLSFCKKITEIPKSFTRLKILNLRQTSFTQVSLNNLPERCPYLEELNLSFCKIITEFPEGFTRLKKLIAFSILTQNAVNSIPKNCPCIEELAFGLCKNITEIPKGLTYLRKLNLHKTNLTQDMLDNLSERCPYLEELDLSGCTNITEFPEGFTRLKILNLAGTGLTQAALNNLPERCPYLEELDLSGCTNITEIPKGLVLLTKLNLSNTFLTQDALDSLPERCSRLEELNLKSCNNITKLPKGLTLLKKLNILYSGIYERLISRQISQAMDRANRLKKPSSDK